RILVAGGLPQGAMRLAADERLETPKIDLVVGHSPQATAAVVGSACRIAVRHDREDQQATVGWWEVVRRPARAMRGHRLLLGARAGLAILGGRPVLGTAPRVELVRRRLLLRASPRLELLGRRLLLGASPRFELLRRCLLLRAPPRLELLDRRLLLGA